jgi:pyrroloquinoline quinone biosynthesis protein B
MRVRVLGTAAGGGFPQWNCGCRNCRGVRSGTIAATPRLQESVAVVARHDAWVLLNASPDVHAQIERTPDLHPRRGRDSPIAAIVLTNGDLDHVLGLLSLREWHPLVVYATARVWSGFRDGNVLFRTLERFAGQVTWRPLALGVRTPILGGDGIDTGLVVTAVAVPGKPPVHLAGLRTSHHEDNVLLRIDDAGPATLVYAPGVGAVTGAVLRALADAACVFFDGTFWSADELVRDGLADKTAAEMAHVPVGGAGGSLEALAQVASPRRFFIHLNNTQPLLRDDAPERALVRARGWDVAEDGMEIAL